MWKKIKLLFTIPDLRKKIFFILALLVLFRLGAAIPVPGVDPERLRAFFAGNQIFGLLNIFSGGALDNLSILMLGVGPYITASIIMQLLTMIFPKIKELYHEEGEAGRAKFNQYTRYLTVPLAALQAFGFLTLLQNQQILEPLGGFGFLTNIVVVTAGTMFLMWLGELITEKGIGNGVSLIIFAGIIASLPQSARQLIATYDPSQIPTYLGFLAAAILVVGGVVIITEGQRKIPVAYAKRIRGMRLYGGVSSHLPLRVNQAGVIPIIFALSILLFPQMLSQIFSAVHVPVLTRLAQAAATFFANPWWYGIFYFLLVALFTYFYTAVTFDPKSIAENVQKAGGYVPGIRPGGPTAEFLSKILNRITLFGALFLGSIAVLPSIVQGATGLQALTIGGTALLIVVSVVFETMKQVEAQLVMREYEGL
ncbi:preprotein translocase subunit SecY [Candidatus Azambacteria bacterium]|nr:preprotein translocase subunit SecY [Candidatus Azambacteria bacterium]